MSEARETPWGDLLRPLGELGRRERRVGDKARKLALLVQANLPVPSTWVLEAQHYQAFIERVLPRKHDIRTLIKLHGTKAGDERCARAYEELLAAPLDESIARAVEAFWVEHGSAFPHGMAVRPSLVGAHAGAAGSHLHSRVGLDSAAAVVEAIIAVWASSVLSHAVHAYADANARDVAVAVLLQEMVAIEHQGLITRTTGPNDPVAGADWHLGVLLPPSRKEWCRRATLLAPLSEGRGAQAAPPPLEELRARLEPVGFEQLLEAGTVAEREIGKGAVVHFAVTGTKVHVLGADEHPRWATLGGGDEATTWVTIGLGMRGLEPTTRLTQSVVERVVRDALESTLATLRCKPERPLIVSRDGRSYLNLVALAEATADLPLVNAEDVLTAVGGFSVERIRRLSARHLGDRGSLWRWPLTGTSAMREQYALERSSAELERGIERDTRALGDMDFTLLPADALSTTLTSAQALLERCAGLWCRFTAAQLGCQLTLRSLLRRRMPDVPDGVTGALTSGVGGLFFPSMAPAFARVVTAFAGEPQVASLLRDTLARGGKLSRPGDLPDGRARGALGHFLARYGDIAFGAFELAVPRWRDDAGELLRMVALALEIGPVRFEAMQNEQRARALADAELLRFEPELSRIERSAVRQLIERYRRLAVGRASVEGHVLRALRLLRAVSVDIDRRLRRIDPAIVEGGAYHSSAERLAGAMKSGRPELTRIIRMRMTERAAESHEPAPPLAFAGSPPRGAIPLLPTAQLNGLGVSPGVIEGRARLVSGVLPEAMNPGEVLVVSALDPAFAPLVAISGAVVAELGGIVSSGAELARELAVPCVTGVADAALHLRDGERLRVDGERGTIQRLELGASVEASGPRPSVESDTRAFSG